MTFEEIFQLAKNLLSKADISKINGKLAFQFNITGEGAGTFYLEVKDGQLNIEPYDYKDRDAEFTASFDVLKKLASGQLDSITAFTLGMLKVNGNITKALELKKMLKHK